MELESIRIRRESYGTNKGKFNGTVEFTGTNSKIELILDEDLSQNIISVCADAIVDASKKAAAIMTTDVIENVFPLSIEAQEERDDDVPF